MRCSLLVLPLLLATLAASLQLGDVFEGQLGRWQWSRHEMAVTVTEQSLLRVLLMPTVSTPEGDPDLYISLDADFPTPLQPIPHAGVIRSVRYRTLADSIELLLSPGTHAVNIAVYAYEASGFTLRTGLSSAASSAAPLRLKLLPGESIADVDVTHSLVQRLRIYTVTMPRSDVYIRLFAFADVTLRASWQPPTTATSAYGWTARTTQATQASSTATVSLHMAPPPFSLEEVTLYVAVHAQQPSSFLLRAVPLQPTALQLAAPRAAWLPVVGDWDWMAVTLPPTLAASSVAVNITQLAGDALLVAAWSSLPPAEQLADDSWPLSSVASAQLPWVLTRPAQAVNLVIGVLAQTRQTSYELHVTAQRNDSAPQQPLRSITPSITHTHNATSPRSLFAVQLPGRSALWVTLAARRPLLSAGWSPSNHSVALHNASSLYLPQDDGQQASHIAFVSVDAAVGQLLHIRATPMTFLPLAAFDVGGDVAAQDWRWYSLRVTLARVAVTLRAAAGGVQLLTTWQRPATSNMTLPSSYDEQPTGSTVNISRPLSASELFIAVRGLRELQNYTLSVAAGHRWHELQHNDTVTGILPASSWVLFALPAVLGTQVTATLSVDGSAAPMLFVGAGSLPSWPFDTANRAVFPCGGALSACRVTARGQWLYIVLRGMSATVDYELQVDEQRLQLAAGGGQLLTAAMAAEWMAVELTLAPPPASWQLVLDGGGTLWHMAEQPSLPIDEAMWRNGSADAVRQLTSGTHYLGLQAPVGSPFSLRASRVQALQLPLGASTGTSLLAQEMKWWAVQGDGYIDVSLTVQSGSARLLWSPRWPDLPLSPSSWSRIAAATQLPSGPHWLAVQGGNDGADFTLATADAGPWRRIELATYTTVSTPASRWHLFELTLLGPLLTHVMMTTSSPQAADVMSTPQATPPSRPQLASSYPYFSLAAAASGEQPQRLELQAAGDRLYVAVFAHQAVNFTLFVTQDVFARGLDMGQLFTTPSPPRWSFYVVQVPAGTSVLVSASAPGGSVALRGGWSQPQPPFDASLPLLGQAVSSGQQLLLPASTTARALYFGANVSADAASLTVAARRVQWQPLLPGQLDDFTIVAGEWRWYELSAPSDGWSAGTDDDVVKAHVVFHASQLNLQLLASWSQPSAPADAHSWSHAASGGRKLQSLAVTQPPTASSPLFVAVRSWTEADVRLYAGEWLPLAVGTQVSSSLARGQAVKLALHAPAFMDVSLSLSWSASSSHHMHLWKSTPVRLSSTEAAPLSRSSAQLVAETVFVYLYAVSTVEDASFTLLSSTPSTALALSLRSAANALVPSQLALYTLQPPRNTAVWLSTMSSAGSPQLFASFDSFEYSASDWPLRSSSAPGDQPQLLIPASVTSTVYIGVFSAWPYAAPELRVLASPAAYGDLSVGGSLSDELMPGDWRWLRIELRSVPVGNFFSLVLSSPDADDVHLRYSWSSPSGQAMRSAASWPNSLGASDRVVALQRVDSSQTQLYVGLQREYSRQRSPEAASFRLAAEDTYSTMQLDARWPADAAVSLDQLEWRLLQISVPPGRAVDLQMSTQNSAVFMLASWEGPSEPFDVDAWALVSSTRLRVESVSRRTRPLFVGLRANRADIVRLTASSADAPVPQGPIVPDGSLLLLPGGQALQLTGDASSWRFIEVPVPRTQALRLSVEISAGLADLMASISTPRSFRQPADYAFHAPSSARRLQLTMTNLVRDTVLVAVRTRTTGTRYTLAVEAIPNPDGDATPPADAGGLPFGPLLATVMLTAVWIRYRVFRMRRRRDRARRQLHAVVVAPGAGDDGPQIEMREVEVQREQEQGKLIMPPDDLLQMAEQPSCRDGSGLPTLLTAMLDMCVQLRQQASTQAEAAAKLDGFGGDDDAADDYDVFSALSGVSMQCLVRHLRAWVVLRVQHLHAEEEKQAELARLAAEQELASADAAGADAADAAAVAAAAAEAAAAAGYLDSVAAAGGKEEEGGAGAEEVKGEEEVEVERTEVRAFVHRRGLVEDDWDSSDDDDDEGVAADGDEAAAAGRPDVEQGAAGEEADEQSHRPAVVEGDYSALLRVLTCLITSTDDGVLQFAWHMAVAGEQEWSGIDELDVLLDDFHLVHEEIEELRSLGTDACIQLARRLQARRAALAGPQDGLKCMNCELAAIGHTTPSLLMPCRHSGPLCLECSVSLQHGKCPQCDTECEAAIPVVVPGAEGGATDPFSTECCVCMDKAVNTVVAPCRHMLCLDCGLQLRTCPLCRSTIRGLIVKL